MEVGGVFIELGQPFEFWGLCAGLLIAYFWTIHRHGPAFHPAPGESAATWAQKFSFVAGVTALMFVSGTPWHDIGEQGLFFFHTVEHMTHAFVVAPLLVMGTPGWMFRMLLRARPVRFVVTRVGRPLPAALVFNAAFAFLHWPNVVDWMLQTPQIHGGVHIVWLTVSVLMWLPVASPAPELVHRLSSPGQMGYLLTMTLLPTVPSSFLTFGQEPAYRVYETFDRMWGIPAVEDMQIAGLIMKIGGGFLLWAIITVKFFRWASDENRRELGNRRGGTGGHGSGPSGGSGGGGQRVDGPLPTAPAPAAPKSPAPEAPAPAAPRTPAPVG